MGPVTLSEVLTGFGVLLSVGILIVANARTQAAMKTIQGYMTERLKKHSATLEKTEVDLLRTTILAEKNEKAIAEMRTTLIEVRDLVLRLVARENP